MERQTYSDISIHLGDDFKVTKHCLKSREAKDLPYFVIKSPDVAATIFLEQKQLDLLVTQLLPFAHVHPELNFRRMVEDAITNRSRVEQEKLYQLVPQICERVEENIEEAILEAFEVFCPDY